MNIPVTRTKYIVPRRRPDLLSRPRLVNVLNDLLDNRLTIIAAPAGYGKTSLLVDIAHQTNMPFCWFAIDSLDRDLKRFATYLIAAINLQFPNFGKQASLVLQNLSQADPDLDLLVTSLVNEAYETIREHFVIVLDDYHFVDGQEDINRFIGKFIREVDENCHLVIASRTLLAIPDLPLMVARSQVGGLGFDELAFQPEEISALIEKNYHTRISDAAAAELVKETEGWITGLLLSTQVKWEGLNDRMRLARVSTAGLYDYMVEQVLEQQPPQIQHFLLQTSVMEEFDAELCEAVFGTPPPGQESWSSLIEVVLRSNLFVLPIGEKGLWLRYHHLFRDFLHEKLLKESPALENKLLKKLADTYTQRGDWERAYVLYSRLNRTEDLVALIEKCGTDLLKLGRITTLSNWIDSVNHTFLENRPTLLSLRGSVAVMQGEVERGIHLLNQCEVISRRTGNQTVLVRMLSRRSHANIYLGNYQEALKDADEALAIARDLALVMDEAEALRCRGLALYSLGQFEAAIQNINLSISTYDAIGMVDIVAVIQIELGRIHRFLGRFLQAQEAYEKALRQFVKVGDLIRQASVQNNLGYLFFAQGSYEKASYYYEQALIAATLSGSLPTETLILIGIGDLYKNIDSPESALIAYSKAKGLLKKINDRFLDMYILLAEAVIYRILGDFIHAEEKFALANDFAGQKKTPSEEALLSYEYGVFLSDRNE
ncbi:MAG TPA: tetratricopeptide repeat protein, partial [Anaerolineaceae bacterium]|nr:tetratricopeptide repeat protein [Anaerolineaceae bacterium]